MGSSDGECGLLLWGVAAGLNLRVPGGCSLLVSSQLRLVPRSRSPLPGLSLPVRPPPFSRRRRDCHCRVVKGVEREAAPYHSQIMSWWRMVGLTCCPCRDTAHLLSFPPQSPGNPSSTPRTRSRGPRHHRFLDRGCSTVLCPPPPTHPAAPVGSLACASLVPLHTAHI